MLSPSPAARLIVVTRQYQMLWPCTSSTRAPYRLARTKPSTKPPVLRASSRALLASSPRHISRRCLCPDGSNGLFCWALSPCPEAGAMLVGLCQLQVLSRAAGAGIRGWSRRFTMRRLQGTVPPRGVPREHPAVARTRHRVTEPAMDPGQELSAAMEASRRQKPPNTSEVPSRSTRGGGCPWAGAEAGLTLPSPPSPEACGGLAAACPLQPVPLEPARPAPCQQVLPGCWCGDALWPR